MVRADTLPLAFAPPSARPFPVQIASAGGIGVSGNAMPSVAIGGSVIFLHQGQLHTGQMEFCDDFSHVLIRGSTKSYPLEEVVFIEW